MGYIVGLDGHNKRKRKDASSMKYVVNENCIGCGLCISICPDYFTMADTGKAVALEAPVPICHENEAEYAAGSCPVDAIKEDHE